MVTTPIPVDHPAMRAVAAEMRGQPEPVRWVTQSAYRVDAWMKNGDHAPVRAAYAIPDQFGWAIVTRLGVRRVDGHTRAARARVLAALGGAG